MIDQGYQATPTMKKSSKEEQQMILRGQFALGRCIYQECKKIEEGTKVKQQVKRETALKSKYE